MEPITLLYDTDNQVNGSKGGTGADIEGRQSGSCTSVAVILDVPLMHNASMTLAAVAHAFCTRIH